MDVFPPRCKRSRKLWHDLQTFKKASLKGASCSFDLPCDSSAYIRACAHHFAHRLGMVAETITLDGAKTVRVIARQPSTTRIEVSASCCHSGAPIALAAASPARMATQGHLTAEGITSASFSSEVGMGAPERKPSRAKPDALKAAKKVLVSRLASCAKRADVDGARAIFKELVEGQVPCTPDICAVLMHIYCGAVILAADSDSDTVDTLPDALEVLDAAGASGCTPDEPTWSGLVKLRCLRGEAASALTHADAMVAAGVAPRLRTFAPILSSACSAGDRALADACVQRVANAGLSLGITEYLNLVCLAADEAAVHATRGEVSPSSALPNALRQMAAIAPLLSEAQENYLHDTFNCDTGARRSGWCIVEARTSLAGVCSVTGAHMRAFELDSRERAELVAVVPRLIGPKSKVQEFIHFTSWLMQNIETHGPFDYVLDGANIGFYGQSKREAAFRKRAAAQRNLADDNHSRKTARLLCEVGDATSAEHQAGAATFALGESRQSNGADDKVTTYAHESSGAFQCAQIDSVLTAVRSANPKGRVLLVLHVSHTDARSTRPYDTTLIQRWRKEGVLYVSPAGMNDDWYWLYAAFASGRACRAVSNDEMRDHHFGMLHSRAFLRWKERHLVRFEIPPNCHEEPILLPPLPYSHTMQESTGGAWHLPRANSVPNGWLCLQPPRLASSAAPWQCKPSPEAGYNHGHCQAPSQLEVAEQEVAHS